MTTIIKQHSTRPAVGRPARPVTVQARLAAQSPVPLMGPADPDTGTSVTGPADPGTSTPLMGTADSDMATPVMARGVSR